MTLVGSFTVIIVICMFALLVLEKFPPVITIFSTPIGYQTNLIVYGPGGYRFKDYIKVGLPLNLIIMATALIIIPLVWKI